jgi:hypothetical protein
MYDFGIHLKALRKTIKNKPNNSLSQDLNLGPYENEKPGKFRLPRNGGGVRTSYRGKIFFVHHNVQAGSTNLPANEHKGLVHPPTPRQPEGKTLGASR